MFLFIVGLIIMAIGVYMLIDGKYTDGSGRTQDIRAWAAIPIVIAVVLVVFSCMRTVPAGHVGVPVVFGSVQQEEKSEGLKFVLPWVGLEKMTVRTQEYTMSSIETEGEIIGDDAIVVKSKDGLDMTMDLTMWFKLLPSEAANVYQKIGDDYVNVIIRPAVRTAIREAANNYSAIQAVTESRDALSNDIQTLLTSKVEGRGIIIERLLLRKITLPGKLEAAIARKMEAEQEAERMEYVLLEEAREAERKVIEAGGIAGANEIIAESLTLEYLRWYWLEHMGDHDNVVYMVPSDGSGLPLFNIPIKEK